MKTDCLYFAIDILIKKKICKHPYTYLIPKEMLNDINKGSIISVPFGKTTSVGVCIKPPYKIHDTKKLKPIIGLSSNVNFNDALINTLNWMSNYYAHNIGESISLALPAFEIKNTTIKKINIANNYTIQHQKLSNSRKKIFENLKHPLTKKQLSQEQKISLNLINKMIAEGQLTEYEEQEEYIFPSNKNFEKTILSDSQEDALNQITIHYQNGWSINLLDGITGSGKTEVYFKLIEKAIEDKKQVLILIPEIGLCQQLSKRFENHFSTPPLIWHSNITKTNKNKILNFCSSGAPLVVIGTRSSLFLPFKNLGAVIIDEEHDQSYKQEEGTIYNARDTAIVRAKNENCICLLCTATPSIETWKNVKQNKSNHIILPSKFSKEAKISFNVIDISINRPEKGKYLTNDFIKLVKNNLNENHQSLIFLNKKGYSSLLICNSCGTKIDCKNCDSYMSYYKSKNILQCNYCNHTIQKPNSCNSCGENDCFVPYGPGIEKIEEEIKENFPNKNIAIATSETLQTTKQIDQFLKDVENNKIDIIIATQIISKGYHFPNLTFVGVVDADWGMFGGNIKNCENTYQLLNQVTGRSGRNKNGIACLQTSNPENRVIKALISNQRDDFLNNELRMRKNLFLPPYTKFISIVCYHPSKSRLDNFIINLYKGRPTLEQAEFYPPIETEIPYIRCQHRMKILIKIAPKIAIISQIKNWIDENKTNDIKIKIDVDPYNFN